MNRRGWLNLPRGQQSGFTLVELMLSMAFISVMMMAIALCVLQIATIYTRGDTLRQVNQSSRTLAVDLRRTLGEAQASFINLDHVDTHQRFCTGQYTYAWTTSESAADAGNSNRYTDPAAGEVRFVRITDRGGYYCRLPGSAPGAVTPNVNSPIDASSANPVELLEEGDRSLRVRSLAIRPAAQGAITGQQLYVIRVILGTDAVEAIDTTSNTCRAPSEVTSDINYCAVNEFTLTVRAGIG